MFKRTPKNIRKDIINATKRFLNNKESVQLNLDNINRLKDECIKLDKERLKYYEELIKAENKELYVSITDISNILKDIKSIRESDEFLEQFLDKIKNCSINIETITKQYNDDDKILTVILNQDLKSGDMAMRLYDSEIDGTNIDNIYDVRISKRGKKEI